MLFWIGQRDEWKKTGDFIYRGMGNNIYTRSKEPRNASVTCKNKNPLLWTKIKKKKEK